jgi:hypothetical protein
MALTGPAGLSQRGAKLFVIGQDQAQGNLGELVEQPGFEEREISAKRADHRGRPLTLE